MTETVEEKFVEALAELESTRDVQPIVALFAEGCEVRNAMMGERVYGIESAYEFWRTYRDTFSGIESVFRNEIHAGNRTALEWRSEGKGRDGERIAYEGVTILEIGGEKITRFHAYFDPGKVERQLSAR